jgi:hypothetical protein
VGLGEGALRRIGRVRMGRDCRQEWIYGGRGEIAPCRSGVRKETRREKRKRREEEECTGVIPANTRIALSIL